MKLFSTRSTLALLLCERREALVRSMVEAANAAPGILRTPWQIGDEAQADVVIRELGNAVVGEELQVEVRRTGQRQCVSMPWPLRSTALFSLLNDAAGHTSAATTLTNPMPAGGRVPDTALVANALLASWLDLRAQGATRIMLHTHHRPHALIDMAMDAYFVPEHATDADSAQLAVRACHGSPEWSVQEELPARWRRGGAARQMLWDLAGVGARAGLLPRIGRSQGARLRGWPYPITQGPAVWGTLAMTIKSVAVPVAELAGSSGASTEELAQFLNGALATGFMRLEPLPHGTPQPVAVTATPRPVRSGSPLEKALGSIRLALGLGTRVVRES